MIDFSFEDLEIDGLEFESIKLNDLIGMNMSIVQKRCSIVDEALSVQSKAEICQREEDKSNVKKKDYQLVIGNITEAAGLSRTYLKTDIRTNTSSML